MQVLGEDSYQFRPDEPRKMDSVMNSIFVHTQTIDCQEHLFHELSLIKLFLNPRTDNDTHQLPG